MSLPREIEERIDWFLQHSPSARGMCAQHTWHSLGGDQGNPPAWGCSDANQCVDKVKASGRYWTPSTWSGPPPRGAWVGYKYGSNGHACLSLGDGRIATTDPGNGAMVGIEDLDYPNKWGASGWDVWTDEYNNVLFEVGDGIDDGDVYLSKLVYGQEDSDSVSRLQVALNNHPLDGGSNLPVTGNYFDQTDHEVRLCQQQHGFGDDPVGGSSVGPSQAAHLFEDTDNNIINDLPTPVPPDPPDPEPEPPDGPGVVNGYGTKDYYTGKKTDAVSIKPGAGWTDIGLSQPHSGITEGNPRDHHFLYTRWEMTAESTAPRKAEVRWVREDGDATAYDCRYVDPKVSTSFPFPTYHTEAGTGLGGKWQAKITGGTDSAKITTRYAKTEIEWQEEEELGEPTVLETRKPFDVAPGVVLTIAIVLLFLAYIAGLIV